MLKVYSPVKWNKDRKSATSYYRVEVPFKGLLELGRGEGFIDDGTWDDVEVSYPMLFGSDIALFYAQANKYIHKIADTIDDLKPGYAQDKTTLLYPPSMVGDIDDNLDYVHPFNMTYSRFGIRGINGEKLNPGDSIVVRGDNGKEIPMWVDKKTAGYKDEVFDIARNYELLE